MNWDKITAEPKSADGVAAATPNRVDKQV